MNLIVKVILFISIVLIINLGYALMYKCKGFAYLLGCLLGPMLLGALISFMLYNR